MALREDEAAVIRSVGAPNSQDKGRTENSASLLVAAVTDAYGGMQKAYFRHILSFNTPVGLFNYFQPFLSFCSRGIIDQGI